MTPAEKLLSKAIRDAAHKLENDGKGDADVAELARVLARVVEGKTIDQAMGAPGDWGYGTPIGDALFALLKEPEPSAPPVVEWHYVEDKLPDDDTAIMVATKDSGQPGEAVYRDDVFLWAGSDIVIPGVYAWADLPEIPEPRTAATPETKGGA
jgi:hypothetical protein